MYQILPYTFNQAKRMGVLISPSEKPKYKIDVYTKSGEFVSSVGSSGYSDYPHYIEERGKEYADNRRRLYKIRHQKDRMIVGSRGWLSDNLLW